MIWNNNNQFKDDIYLSLLGCLSHVSLSVAFVCVALHRTSHKMDSTGDFMLPYQWYFSVFRLSANSGRIRRIVQMWNCETKSSVVIDASEEYWNCLSSNVFGKFSIELDVCENLISWRLCHEMIEKYEPKSHLTKCYEVRWWWRW